jgi:hypothetical protein
MHLRQTVRIMLVVGTCSSPLALALPLFRSLCLVASPLHVPGAFWATLPLLPTTSMLVSGGPNGQTDGSADDVRQARHG